MWRILKWLVYLAALGAVALVAYAYIGPYFGADFSAPREEMRAPQRRVDAVAPQRSTEDGRDGGDDLALCAGARTAEAGGDRAEKRGVGIAHVWLTPDRKGCPASRGARP